MNQDQVKGKLKEAAGEVQERAGRAVDSKEHEAKGHAREMEGKMQKKVGDVEEVAKDATDDLTKKP